MPAPVFLILSIRDPSVYTWNHSFSEYHEWMVSSAAAFNGVLGLASLVLRFSTRPSEWFILNTSRRFSGSNVRSHVIDMSSFSFSFKAFWANPFCVFSRLRTLYCNCYQYYIVHNLYI